MNHMVDISHYVLNTNVLGPFDRSALWVHGCCFHCDGCIASDMNSQPSNYVQTDKLAEIFSGVQGTEGITISGGEPFLQAASLSRMIREIRKNRDYGVIVYTGFLLEELRKNQDAGVQELLNLTDLVIEGRYQKELDDGMPYRGSSNQKILLLSDRYREVYQDYYFTKKTRDIEIQLKESQVFLVGVPSKRGLDTWRDLKKRAEGNG